MVAILNIYDDLLEDKPVREGDYIKSITNEFGLTEDKKYKILEVNSYDMVTVEAYEGYTEMYSIELFEEC